MKRWHFKIGRLNLAAWLSQPKGGYTPTTAERQAIAEHLKYELRMLHAAEQAQAANQAAVNVIVESFVVHTRTLVDFFYFEPTGDDVIARHFFSNPKQWAKVRPNITGRLKKARKRANKEVMHLTYTRLSVTAQDKPWPKADIVADIAAAFDAFAANADLLTADLQGVTYQDVVS